MTGLNKVILIGNLGADPEIRTTQSQKTVATLDLATTETYRVGGEKRQTTEWHRVVLWNHLAEIAEKYLTKGRQIMVEGRISYRKWKGNGRFTRTITEITADTMLMLGTKTEPVAEEVEEMKELPF